MPHEYTLLLGCLLWIAVDSTTSNIIKSNGFQVNHNTYAEDFKRISYCSGTLIRIDCEWDLFLEQTITSSEAILYSNISGTIDDQEVICQWTISPSNESIKHVYETYCNSTHEDDTVNNTKNFNTQKSFKKQSKCHNSSDVVIEIWLNLVLDTTNTIITDIYAVKSGSTTPTLVASYVGEYNGEGNQPGISILYSQVSSVIVMITAHEQLDSHMLFNATYVLTISDAGDVPSEEGFIIATAVIVCLAFVGAVLILSYLKYQKEHGKQRVVPLMLIIKPNIPSSWNKQRLVWIGHLKNSPSMCWFARLPPEVISLISRKI